MTRTSQRQITATEKAKQAKEQEAQVVSLRDVIESGKENIRSLQDELNNVRGVSKKSRLKASIAPADASSSGRVASTTKTKGKARAAADPYPTRKSSHILLGISVPNSPSRIGSKID